jgi:sugar phosphate isomerase/epimerase
MDRLSLEPLSVMGCPPPDWVNLAGDLGLRYVTLVLQGMGGNPDGFRPWSLRNESDLRAQTRELMRAKGIHVSLIDGFVIRDGTDVQSFRADMTIASELGAPRVNTVSFVADPAWNVRSFRAVAEMAAEHRMVVTLEFAPTLAIRTLHEAIDVIHRVDRPNFRLLLDTMHLFRSGGSAVEVAKLDRDLIQYVQLSDVPLVATNGDYMDESCFERMVPGTGELPLADLLPVLPADVIIGLEVPLRSLAEAGVSPLDRLSPSVRAARDLLANAVHP